MIVPRFVIEQLPAGISGLVIAGILAAAMSTISSSINALASSVTHDFYAGWSGRRDPAHLLKVGRFFTTVWGIALVAAAMAFWEWASLDTPVVVLALSVASVTYGALLGTYVLAGRWRRASGRDVILATVVTVVAMLGVVFAKPLTATGLFPWLEPAASLAWPWYVPLGTLLTLAVGIGSSLIRPERVSP
jgi:SSS family solute:Na+ symporter